MTGNSDAAAHVCRRRLPRNQEGGDLTRIGVELSVGLQERTQPVAQHAPGAPLRRPPRPAGRGPNDCRTRRVAAVEKNLQARAARCGHIVFEARLRHDVERPHILPAQRREHALDMFAGAQTIDAMIDAAAGIDMLFEAADLDLIIAATFRADAKRAEDRLLGLQRLDRSNFRAPAPAAQRDFILVGGAPALRLWRPIQDGARTRCLARAMPFRCLLCRRVGSSHRVRIFQHGWTVGRVVQFDQCRRGGIRARFHM